MEIKKLNEEVKVLQARLDALQKQNLGITYDQYDSAETKSIMQELNNGIKIKEKNKQLIVIGFLQHQNKAQLERIKVLESKKSATGSNDELIRQVNIAN